MIFEAPHTDFYGFPRPDPVDRWVDMGAIESPFDRLVYIPDTAFLYALIEEGVDANGDGQISYAEAEVVTSLDVSGDLDCNEDSCWSSGQIASLVGIEAFINLEVLNCGANQLASFDLSNNTVLVEFRIRGNDLTSLDVSNNTALLSLSCNYNSLTSLDVSNNTELGSLDIQQMPSLY